MKKITLICVLLAASFSANATSGSQINEYGISYELYLSRNPHLESHDIYSELLSFRF